MYSLTKGQCFEVKASAECIFKGLLTLKENPFSFFLFFTVSAYKLRFDAVALVSRPHFYKQRGSSALLSWALFKNVLEASKRLCLLLLPRKIRLMKWKLWDHSQTARNDWKKKLCPCQYTQEWTVRESTHLQLALTDTCITRRIVTVYLLCVVFG